MVLNILRRNAVQKATGLSRSSIYERMAQGDFPKPIPLGPRAVGWVESEVMEWVRERIVRRDKGAARKSAKGKGR
jgi:prophage regulatory protein